MSNDWQGDLVAMVEDYGIHVVADALLELASGSNIRDILQAAERRAIRIAADIEAAETLK